MPNTDLALSLHNITNLSSHSAGWVPPSRRRALQQHVFSLLHSCNTLRNLIQIHSQVVLNGLSHRSNIIAKLLSFYLASDQLQHAHKLFAKVDTPSTTLWNHMIRGYARSHMPWKSVECYSQMVSTEADPNGFTYSFLLSACARGDMTHKHSFLIYEILCEITKQAHMEGYKPDITEVFLDVEHTSDMGPPLNEDRSEIVFFDLETTVPTRPGQGFAILEFGAILVCPRKLTEIRNYSTLVRPADMSLISPLSERCNGITAEAVSAAPTFADIASTVYDLLHGRIWAGHNIIRFDCVRVRDAFAEINLPPPEPKGTIDSLVLLTQKFGRRAGNMKMATLATYFGLGRQTHRSLDDVRMNLEVLKYCATVLFLESSLPDIFTANSWVSPNATTRSRSNGKSPSEGGLLNMNKDSVLLSSPETKEKNHPILSLTMSSTTGAVPSIAHPDIDQSDRFDMSDLQACSSSIVVLEPDKICIPSIDASLVPSFYGSQRIELHHEGFPFQLCCADLKVRFGISTKFVDNAGRPRLSIVVDPSPSLCNVLDACDNVARKLSSDSGSLSDWRPVVIRKEGYFNYPTVRLHIPTAVCEDIAIYATEIYQKESSGAVQRLIFSKFDAAELGSLFMPGTFVDAFFSLDPYDYQQNAGIKLVAKKMIIHGK
ncbi:Tetratricopeptide-like helical domain superfamily [Sesbania bispinosa]|nr:Tetratricopeptide-like helical domain superfamily [Sesbania bispinosa]